VLPVTSADFPAILLMGSPSYRENSKTLTTAFNSFITIGFGQLYNRAVCPRWRNKSFLP